MEKHALRLLETSPEDLEACKTENLVRIFREVSAVPKHAKELRGRIFLAFPSYDDDPRPNWQIPSVRLFVRDLQRRLPHFAYFLVPDVAVGHVTMYLLCLVDVGDDASIRPDNVGMVLSDIVTALEGFCESIADRSDAVVRSLYLNLPRPILLQIPELRREALQSMAPTLKALAAGPGEEEGSEFRAALLRDACELAGVDARAYGSDEELLAHLLAKAEQ